MEIELGLVTIWEIHCDILRMEITLIWSDILLNYESSWSHSVKSEINFYIRNASTLDNFLRNSQTQPQLPHKTSNFTQYFISKGPQAAH